jgi:hypothetical protein
MFRIVAVEICKKENRPQKIIFSLSSSTTNLADHVGHSRGRPCGTLAWQTMWDTHAADHVGYSNMSAWQTMWDTRVVDHVGHSHDRPCGILKHARVADHVGHSRGRPYGTLMWQYWMFFSKREIGVQTHT